MNYNPLVYLSKTLLMQRVNDFVRAGYTCWTSGEIAPEKLSKLVHKFVRYYRIDLNKSQRFRLKKQGEGNAVLLMWFQEQYHRVTWFLLVTEGSHPAHTIEKLKSVESQRVTLTGYELVQITKPIKVRDESPSVIPHDASSGSQQDAGKAVKQTPRQNQYKKAGGKLVWTWRMTAEKYQEWRDRIILEVRQHHMKAIKASVMSLNSVPGYFGIRSQVGKLVALLNAEWKRVMGTDSKTPRIPKLRYVQRLPDDGIRLTQFAKWMKK